MATSSSQTGVAERRGVLVVEDEPVLRIEVADMFEEIGFEVVEATGVGNAVRLLETRPDIRIVYMDLDMPKGVDGVKIAAAIRDRWPPIEIVLTASRLDAGRIGLPVRSKFFPKPIDHAGVIKAMRALAGDL